MANGVSGAWTPTSTFNRTWAAQVNPGSMRFYNDDAAIPRTTDTGSDALTHLNGYLSWTAVPGATGYDVEVSPQENFASSSIMLFSYNRSAARIVLPHLPDDTYYWRVRANDAHGAHGSWVTGPQFQIAWTTMTSVAAAAPSQNTVYPSNNAAMGSIAVGWKPVPGASYYEVEAATNQACFASNQSTLHAWGDWVAESRPQSPLDCRVTDAPHLYTVNNFVTKIDLIGSQVRSNIAAAFSNGGDVYTPLMARTFFWRVRPVFTFNGTTETSWDVSGDITEYGRWLEYTGGGSPQPFRFTQNKSLSDSGSESTDCDYNLDDTSYTDWTALPAPFDGRDCLVGKTTTMEPTNGAAADSTSTQLPLMRWKRWHGFDNYRVQVARDQNFDAIVLDVEAEGTEWAPTFSLPDNSLSNGSGDTGYWWRAVPCAYTYSSSSRGQCQPVYYPAAAGTYDASRGERGERSFTKNVAIVGNTAANFAGSTPLLTWNTVQGAAYYEVQMSVDPFFSGAPNGTCGSGAGTDTVSVQRTGVPRLLPITNGESGSRIDVGDGTWFWRVRACDASDVGGASSPVSSGWSDVLSFTKQTPAPGLTGPASGTSTSAPVLSWTSLDGALSYEVQWDNDPSFLSPDGTASTYQTAFQLPAGSGTWYWRVRARNSGNNPGTWSPIGPYVIVVPEDALSYAVARQTVVAKQHAFIEGKLDVAGAPTDGRMVVLQRKTTRCGTTSGTYIAIARARTGASNDEGTVRFRTRLGQNACFRFLYDNGSTKRYSAPIPMYAKPKTSWKISAVKFRRAKAVKLTIRTNIKISGRIRLQYKVRGTWHTARSMKVNRKRRMTMRATINRAGRFKTRLFLDRMGSQSNTIVKGKTVRVNDVYVISR